jgi:hypothetical protein
MFTYFIDNKIIKLDEDENIRYATFCQVVFDVIFGCADLWKEHVQHKPAIRALEWFIDALSTFIEMVEAFTTAKAERPFFVRGTWDFFQDASKKIVTNLNDYMHAYKRKMFLLTSASIYRDNLFTLHVAAPNEYDEIRIDEMYSFELEGEQVGFRSRTVYGETM